MLWMLSYAMWASFLFAMTDLWNNKWIVFFLYYKCYLTYLEVARYWIVDWCYHAFYVQHPHLSLISLYGVGSSQSMYTCGFSSSVSQAPAAGFLFFWQLVSGMLDSRANVEERKPTYILQTERLAPPDVALCCGACPGTQQCLPVIWSNSREHNPSTGCMCAHCTIRDPSKCCLFWCLQLPFA